MVKGGFGEQINSIITNNNLNSATINLGIPDSFIEQGTVLELQKICKIDVPSLIQFFNIIQND